MAGPERCTILLPAAFAESFGLSLVLPMISALAEVREMLTTLQTISGRYGGVRAEGMAARDCFRITSAPA